MAWISKSFASIDGVGYEDFVEVMRVRKYSELLHCFTGNVPIKGVIGK